MRRNSTQENESTGEVRTSQVIETKDAEVSCNFMTYQNTEESAKNSAGSRKLIDRKPTLRQLKKQKTFRSTKKTTVVVSDAVSPTVLEKRYNR